MPSVFQRAGGHVEGWIMGWGWGWGRGTVKGWWGGNSFTAGWPQGSTFSTGILSWKRERRAVIAFFWVKTSSRHTHTVSHRWHHINISDQMKRSCSQGISKGLSVQRLGCKYSRLGIGQINVLFFFFRGFVLPLSFKHVWLSSSFIKQQLVFIFFKKSWAAWGVYRLRDRCLCSLLPSPAVESQQHLSLWIWLLYPLKREGWWRGSSYGWEINKTCHLYEQRWALRLFAALVWPVSLSSALNGSLCDCRAMWGRTWKSHIKETVVDLGRQMGQYIKWVCGDLINWLI